MGKRKVKTFVARMRKIWVPALESPTFSLIYDELGFPQWSCDLEPNARLSIGEYAFSAHASFCFFLDRYISEDNHTQVLLASTLGKEVGAPGEIDGAKLHFPSDYEKDVFLDQHKEDVLFADRWLPFFRRGCWLSGCPLETSAHERIEWIRGFTHEEIESWNLNG